MVFDFGAELREIVEYDIYNCIGCNRCMDACPVTKKENLTIAELNEATIQPEAVKSGPIYDFTVNCVQCARCVPVCPPGVRRDLMMLYLKWKLDRESAYPKEYNRYVIFKKPDIGAMKRGIMKLRTASQKEKLGVLFPKVDNFEDLRKAELLFYPGCYIYNEVCHKTLALMEFLGEDYEVLGGYASCCGWPQYLQGRMDMANELLANLWKLIQKVKPKRIITTCAECYAALRKIRAMYADQGADFIPLSTTEWLLENIDKFPIQKSDDKFTLHESCHLSRKYRHFEKPRQCVEAFGDLVEMDEDEIRDKTQCCYYYNFELDPNNKQFRTERLEHAKSKADKLVVDCITCYEVYKEKMAAAEFGLEVIDINELFFSCIKDKVNQGGAGN